MSNLQQIAKSQTPSRTQRDERKARREASRKWRRKKKEKEGGREEGADQPPTREEPRCGKFCNLNPMESQRQA